MYRRTLFASLVFASLASQTAIGQTYVSNQVSYHMPVVSQVASPIPLGTTKQNVHGLSSGELAAANHRGRLSFLEYPTKSISLAIPYDSLNRLFNTKHRRPLVRIGLRRNNIADIGNNWRDVWSKSNLFAYPMHSGHGAYHIPTAQSGRPSTPIGFPVFWRNNARVFTLSCESCHTRNLFGRPVFGATNLLGGSGNTMLLLQRVSGLNDFKYRFATRAGGADQHAFQTLRHRLSFVHGRRAAGPGLENPVAFVGLSMSARSPDASLTRNYRYRNNTYHSPLRHLNTDTKAPVLWNLKYKNRFQHDGSMTGDPMLANLIFNEIGRGGDMPQLENWIRSNPTAVRDLSVAGYASEAPRWTDFFAAESIRPDKARRGELVYLDRCARCHGEYEKAWSQPGGGSLPWRDQLKTTRVIMPEENTIARNVGTDSGRSTAMTVLAPMANRLSVFRNNGISFTSNPGAYVPPPLVGIWARWPYMHNNSIPNLEQLLTPARQRTPYFYIGPANNPNTDYDTSSVGFPISRTPRSWMRSDRLFDTRRPGLSNAGHDEGIFASGGRSELTHQEKYDLIEFLKTL